MISSADPNCSLAPCPVCFKPVGTNLHVCRPPEVTAPPASRRCNYGNLLSWQTDCDEMGRPRAVAVVELNSGQVVLVPAASVRF